MERSTSWSTQLSLMIAPTKPTVLTFRRFSLLNHWKVRVTRDQLFQLKGQLYEQTDGVAMASALVPQMASAFLCHLEETIPRDGLMPDLYKTGRWMIPWLKCVAPRLLPRFSLLSIAFTGSIMEFTMELLVCDKILLALKL